MTITSHRQPASDSAAASSPLGGSMPGWHVVADLTPPELIMTRRVRVVRFIALLALVVVAAACAGGYMLARAESQLAEMGAVAEEGITTALLNQKQEYANVTAMQNQIAKVANDTAALMATDTDFSALLGSIFGALPDGMAINDVTLTVPAGLAAGSSNGSDGFATLDASGDEHVGQLELNGTGTAISDVSAFIDQLAELPGVFDPVPLSNSQTEDGTEFSVQVTLTDAVLTGRFETSGGN